MNADAVRMMTEKWKTPFYAYEPAKFQANFQSLENAYRSCYPEFRIAYSFKTNYTPTICRQVLELGGIAEVVSGMEYRLAKKVGFQPSQIIVNGPAKWDEIGNMLAEGSLVMLDNWAELDRAIQCAEDLDHPVRVGFRLNFTIGGGKNSRFGFDVENRATAEAIQRARKAKNIRIEGIHFHLSGARSRAAWQMRAEKMVAFADTLLLESECKVIDLGSGMFGRMEPSFAAQFDQDIPTFGEYAEVVGGVFEQHYGHLPKEKRPVLVVEPGTTLVANTMSYVTKVLAVKTIRGRNIAIVDGSAHHVGELCKKKRLPISIISCAAGEKISAPVEITGYTCLEDDVLHPDCGTGVGVGDYVHIRNTGSYSNVLAPPFIQEGCAMVEYVGDSSMRLIRRGQVLEDIFGTYVFD